MWWFACQQGAIHIGIDELKSKCIKETRYVVHLSFFKGQAVSNWIEIKCVKIINKALVNFLIYRTELL